MALQLGELKCLNVTNVYYNSVWSFDIIEGILRNQKFIIGSVHFLSKVLFICLSLDYISLCIDYPVESCKITVFHGH